MRVLRNVVAGLLISGLVLMAAVPPVPRPSPDFIVHFNDGTEISLHSLRGKVVALPCIFTTCVHCQHASEVFTKLYQEYGSRGFEPVGVAFNPMANLYVADFIKDHGIKHPVGFSAPEKVLEYLGISPMERYVVPQIVWIDRKGNIRSQTTAMGEEKYLQEPYWREMIETLLKEPGETTKKPAATHAKKTP